MKTFIFDPLWDDIVEDVHLNRLDDPGIEKFIIKEIAPLNYCKELFEGTEERIICINPDYVSWKLSADDYKNIPNLKAILIASTSYSWIDTSYADDKNIPIINIKNFSSQSVAEWAVMMVLSLARQTPRLIKDGFPLDYDNDYMGYRGIELKGKVVGIAGLGNIGKCVASLCEGLGMKVIYWSRSTRDDRYQYVELQQMFKEADVVIPTIAHIKETENIITEDMLDSIKKSAIVVSVVEKMFRYDKLISKVEKGELFGFGFEDKPKAFGNYKGNVWAAPAYGWATKECMSNSMTKLVDNIIDANNGSFPNRVNI